MDEDRLSPQLGRLIDEAKAAARRADAAAPRAEGVALLAEDGSVYTGHPGAGHESPRSSAAEAARASADRAGCKEIVAAAVAVANDPADTVLPSAECRLSLAGINPDLSLVVKQHGRWVLLALSDLPSPE